MPLIIPVLVGAFVGWLVGISWGEDRVYKKIRKGVQSRGGWFYYASKE